MSNYWAPSKEDPEDPNSAWNQIRSILRRDKRLPTYAPEPEEEGERREDPMMAEDYATEGLEQWRGREAGESEREIEGTNVAQTGGVESRVQTGMADYQRPEATPSGPAAVNVDPEIGRLLEERGYLPTDLPLAVMESLGEDPSRLGSFKTIGPRAAQQIVEKLQEFNVPEEYWPQEGEPWGAMDPIAVEMLLL